MLPPTALTDNTTTTTTTTTATTTGVNPNRTRRPSTTGPSHSAGPLSTFDRSHSFSSSIARRSSNDISPGFASTKASIDADVAVVPSSLDRLINKPFGRAASFTNGTLSNSTDHHQQHRPQHQHHHQHQQHHITQPNDIPEHINTPPFHSSSPLTHSTWRPSESLFPPTYQHQQSQHSNLLPPSGSPFSQTDGSSPNHRSQLSYSQHSLYAHQPSTSHRLSLSSAPTMTSLTATPVASSSTTNATTTTISTISTNNTQPMPTYKSNQHLGPPSKRPLRMLQEGDKEVIDLEDTTSGESEDESEDEEISVVIERPEFEAFLTEDIKPDLAFIHQNGNSHLERKGKDLSIELNDDVNMSDDVDDDDDDDDEEDDEDEDDEDEDEGRPARLSSSSTAAAAAATNSTDNITASTINAPFPSALSTPATIGLGLSLVDDTHQATAPILLGSSIALATNSTATSAGLPSEPTPSGLLLSPIDDGTPTARPNSATLSGTSLTLGLATPPIVNTDSDSASDPVSATAVATDTAPVAVVASKRKRKRTPSPSPPPAPVKPDITLRLEHTLDGPASEFSLYDRAYEMEFYDEDTMENFSLRGMLGGLWAEEEDDEDGNDDEEGGTEEERLARELEKRYGNKKTSAISIKKKSKDNEYDITDAFVDDSTQGIDEPHFSGIPAKPGFYVCRGDVVLQGEEKNPITLIPSTKPKPAKKAASVVSANATLPIPLSTPASVPSPAPVSTSASHTLLAHSASAPALPSSSVSSSGPADPAVSQPSKAKKPKLDGRPTEENILQPRPKPKSRPSSAIAPSAVLNSAVPNTSTSANSTLNANASTGLVGSQTKSIPPSTESLLPFSPVVAPSGSGPDPTDPPIVSTENDHSSSSSAAAAAVASLQGKPSKVGTGPVSVVTGTGSASAPFDVDKSDEIEIVKPTPSPALREKLDELKKQVKKENWTNKAKFPPRLKPVLLDVAKTALLTGFYGESLFELMPTIFPYNKFTMTKLIKREIYEFHDGLLQIKRRDLLEEFANEINRVKEDVFEKYEQSLQQWEETQKKKQIDKEIGEGSEVRPGTPSTLIMDSPGHHAQASSVSASVDPGSPNSRLLGPLPPDSAPPATTTDAHTPTGYTPNHSTIPLPPPGTPPSRQPVEDKPPSRKFRFNERMKDLLTQLMDVTSDTLTLANEKARYEGGQEKHLLPLNRALYADMNKLFPPGWVQNTQISREVSFIKKRKTRSEGKNTPVELV